MVKGYWRKHEDDYLIAHQEQSNVEIAKALGRTRQSVVDRKSYLGLRRNREPFKGCNDDCFNCVYDDCIKPDKEFKDE